MTVPPIRIVRRVVLAELAVGETFGVGDLTSAERAARMKFPWVRARHIRYRMCVDAMRALDGALIVADPSLAWDGANLTFRGCPIVLDPTVSWCDVELDEVPFRPEARW